MARVEYTESDLWIKDGLECLFWIEIAKRKARLSCGDAFSQLMGMRGELEGYFASFAEELEEPCEGGEEVVFNIVQFGRNKLDHVNDPQHVELIKNATRKFGKRVSAVMESLDHHRGFRLADFSTETDLALLHDWWSYIISSKGRKELNTKGKFSSIGEARPVIATEEVKFCGQDEPTIKIGDAVSTITSLQNPVRYPIRVRSRGFDAYSTDDYEITINSRGLQDKLMLEIDLLKPLPPMRKIEAMLHIEQQRAKTLRMVERINRGIFEVDDDDDSFKANQRYMLDLMTEPPESHQLMVAFTSARPMMAGLACWDYTAMGMSDAQAAAKVAEEFLGVDGAKVLEKRQVVRALKDVVRPHIEGYEPGKLPWWSAAL